MRGDMTTGIGRDRERWEGDIEARLKMAERRLDNINGHIGDLADAVNGLRTDLARFASKTGVYMGLAGAVAAADQAVVNGNQPEDDDG